MEIKQFPIVIVGTGLFGLTVARRLTEDLNIPILLVEKRTHIGGNAWSEFDPDTGIEIHKYGSHIFHTSNELVWQWVTRFASFNNYQHRVKAVHKKQVFSMPINLHTINQFLGKALTPQQAEEWIKSHKDPMYNLGYDSFESKAISVIGRPLYDAFFYGYTKKQWQTDPKNLPPETFSRLPFRLNYDDRYFKDKYEGIPSNGYKHLIEELASHSNFKILQGTDFFDLKPFLTDNQIIVYSGPIDRFFDYRLGRLNWRTLDLQIQKLDVPDFQGTSVVNYVDDNVPYTRIHEFQHFAKERHSNLTSTIIMYEFSRFATSSDEPYYPVNSQQDRSLIKSYRELADREKNVFFGGRLGRYQYLDMHMAIAAAFQTSEEVKTAFLKSKHI